MKIRIIEPVRLNGDDLKSGEVYDVEDDVARELISRALATSHLPDDVNETKTITTIKRSKK